VADWLFFRYLVGSLPQRFRLPDNAQLLHFGQHGLDCGFMLGAEMLYQLLMGFYLVWGLPEVGDEIEDVDFLHHKAGILMMVRKEGDLVTVIANCVAASSEFG
jgi:hypothetical protein